MPPDDAVYSIKIRANAVSVHKHRILVGSHGYPTKYNINK